LSIPLDAPAAEVSSAILSTNYLPYDIAMHFLFLIR
jgi:hypothetical protein